MRHLIHIGFAKAGSNTLRRWFEHHPQLVFAKGGIAGFSDVHAIARQAYTPRAGARWRVTSSEGLATPSPFFGLGQYDYETLLVDRLKAAQEQGSATLAEIFPTATILVVTRGIRSWILSGYSQYLRTGGTRDFEVYLEERASSGVFVYDRIIGHYRKRFGEDGVIVVPLELLRDDPAGFIRALEERLGLDPAPFAVERLNESLSPEALYWYPRISALMMRLPGRLRRAYLKTLMSDRLTPLIGFLSRLRPQGRITRDLITDAGLEAYRGIAHSLRDNPLYAPYRADYLM